MKKLCKLIALLLCTHVAQGQVNALGSSDTYFNVCPINTIKSCIDANGNYYVVFGDSWNSNALTILKISGTTYTTLLPGYTVAPGSLGAGYVDIAKDNNNNIYVAFSDNANSSKISVAKYDGTSWSILGSAGFSAGIANYIDIAVDNNNTPYVCYQDVANNSAATVMSYNGTTWSTVGNAGFTPGTSKLNCLQIDANNVPYIAFKDSYNSNKASVMKYTNNTWSYVGSPAFSAGTVNYFSFKLGSVTGNPYLLFQDNSLSNRITLMTYNGTTWSSVGNVGFNSTSNSALYCSLYLSSNETPYAAYMDNANAGYSSVQYYTNGSWQYYGNPGISNTAAAFQDLNMDASGSLLLAQKESGENGRLTIKKYFSALSAWLPIFNGNGIYNYCKVNAMAINNTGNTYLFYTRSNNSDIGSVKYYNGNSWAYAGNTDFTNSNVKCAAMAINNNKVPYVAYTYFNGILYFSNVMYLNNNTWTNLNASSFPSTAATEMALAFDASNNLFMAIKSKVDSKLYVYKCDGSTWTTLGSPPISAGTVTGINMVIDNTGAPIVSYNDGANSNKLSVLKYNGSAWNYLGSAGVSAGSAGLPAMTIDASNNVYIAFIDGANSSKLTTMLYNGSSWSILGSAGISAAAAGSPAICLDSANVVYVAYQDAANNYKLSIMRYANNTWSAGNNLACSNGYCTYIDMAYNKNIGVVVSYEDEQGYVLYLPYSTNFQNTGIITPNAATTFPLGPADANPACILGSAPPGAQADANGNYYIVAADSGNSNKITLYKYNGTSWSTYVSSYITSPAYGSFAMTLDNSANVYVAFADYSQASYKLSVIKFNGTTWSVVGSQGISAGGCKYICMTNNNTTLFVGYSDVYYNNKATILKYNGSTWSNVGAAGFTSSSATYLSIGYQANFNILLLAFADGAYSNKLSVMNYYTSWTYNTSCAGVSANPANYISLIADAGPSDFYVCYTDLSTSKTLLVSQINGTLNTGWGGTTISYSGSTNSRPNMASYNYNTFLAYADNGVANGALITLLNPNSNTFSTFGNQPISYGQVGGITVKCNASGNPYLAYTEANLSNKLTVKAYQNGNWSNLGSSGIVNSVANFASAIDNNGIPYIFYDDNKIISNQAGSVLKYDGANWVALGASQFTASAFNYCAMAFNSSNTPYVAYEDQNNGNKLCVMKFNGSNWNYIGTDFSVGTASFIDMKIDANNNIYVAYADGSNSNKITVQKYNGSAWSIVGTAGFSAGAATYIKLAISSTNFPYVAYSDGANSGKLSLQMFNGSSWAVQGSAGVSAGSCSWISLALNASNVPYIAYCDAANSNKASIQYYNGTWNYLGSAGFTQAATKYTQLVIDNSNSIYIAYQDAANSYRLSYQMYNNGWSNTNYYTLSTEAANFPIFLFHKYLGYYFVFCSEYLYALEVPVCLNFCARTSGALTNANNWIPAVVPSQYNFSNYFIPSGLNYTPTLDTGTLTFTNTTINAPVINIATGAQLNITGNITFGAATQFKWGGLLNFNGLNAQYIYSNAAIFHNVSMSNPSGITLSSGNLYIDSVYYPTSGIFNTNNNLYLNNGANIAQSSGSGGYIYGMVNVTINTSIARRAYRFLGHPFSNALPLSQLMTGIDITGTGGASNGFTTTAYNNPSAFWYNASTGNASITNDPDGWIAFTSTNGQGSNQWNALQGIRVLIRGAVGQGLNNTNYTPSTTSYTLYGNINQGTQAINLPYTTTRPLYSLVANPYPSTINLNTVNINSGIFNTYYIWDPSLGTKGAYVTKSFLNTYYLPTGAAFFAKVNTNYNVNLMTFTESCKVNVAPGLAFKTNNTKVNGLGKVYTISLKNAFDSIIWDRTDIFFKEGAPADSDCNDGSKWFKEDGKSLYTLSADNKTLAINNRPLLSDSEHIVIGIGDISTGNYILQCDTTEIDSNLVYYLADNYLQTLTPFTKGSTYKFSVSTDTSITLTDRFMLLTENAAKLYTSTELVISPNPTDKYLHIVIPNNFGTNIKYKITDLMGKQYLKQGSTLAQSNNLAIDVSNLPHGMYVFTLIAGDKLVSTKFEKK